MKKYKLELPNNNNKMMMAGYLFRQAEDYLRDILQPREDKWSREWCLNTSYYFSKDGLSISVWYHLRLGGVGDTFETTKSFYCIVSTDLKKQKKEIEDWLEKITKMANAYRKIFN